MGKPQTATDGERGRMTPFGETKAKAQYSEAIERTVGRVIDNEIVAVDSQP